MFSRDVDYPTAVASSDDDGVDAAIYWSCEYLQDDDVLTVWTSLKSNLSNNDKLHTFVNRHSNVEHVTGRGGSFLSSSGPVLMAWPRMDDIGELVRYGHGIRSLCVIAWNEDEIRPWVAATNPTVLGDGSAWDKPVKNLDPIVVEALKGLTLSINHNNTISAGFEKDQVVSVLLALRKAKVPMDGEDMQGWALANGWAGKNPQRLADYVRDINAGKTPRARRVLRADYIERLRARAAGDGAANEA